MTAGTNYIDLIENLNAYSLNCLSCLEQHVRVQYGSSLGKRPPARTGRFNLQIGLLFPLGCFKTKFLATYQYKQTLISAPIVGKSSTAM